MMDHQNFSQMCLMNLTSPNDNNSSLNGTEAWNSSLCGAPGGWIRFHQYLPPSTSYLKMVSFLKWAIPVVFAIGVPLNVLSVYIFTKTKLKNTSSSRYLAAIAVVDSGYLFTKLMVDLSMYYRVPVYEIHGACQIIYYVNSMSIFLSHWYVTALVVEKFIGMYWPVRKATYCTVFRAKCVIISFFVMAIVLYHYLTWTWGYDDHFQTCMPYMETSLYEAYERMNTMDYILVAILPFLIIFILLIAICIKSWKYYRMSRRTGRRVIYNCQRVCQEKEFKTTLVVISVAFFTFSLGLLNSIYRIFRLVQPLIMLVATFLQLISLSFKTVVYCCVSASYRRQIRKMLRGMLQTLKCLPAGFSDQAPEMHDVKQQTDSSDIVTYVTEKPV